MGGASLLARVLPYISQSRCSTVCPKLLPRHRTSLKQQLLQQQQQRDDRNHSKQTMAFPQA
jgi:hypothetical protein